MAQVYFENIRNVILDELDKAENVVQIAVAWFTDTNLFDKLLELSKRGVQIELIILDDKINNESSIDYTKLIDFQDCCSLPFFRTPLNSIKYLN